MEALRRDRMESMEKAGNTFRAVWAEKIYPLIKEDYATMLKMSPTWRGTKAEERAETEAKAERKAARKTQPAVADMTASNQPEKPVAQWSKRLAHKVTDDLGRTAQMTPGHADMFTTSEPLTS